MSHRSFSISITIFLLLCSSSARSQEPATPRSSDESAVALRKKAIDLLVSVAGQVDSLRSLENRARINSNLGESLWDHDEKRSRSLFAAVEEDIKSGLSDSEPDESAHTRTLLVFWKLRSDTIERIAKHDPEFALEFLRATRAAPGVQIPTYLVGDTEKSLQLRLARQIAAKEPRLALQLGRQSLTNGFSPDLLAVVARLQLRDKELSRSLYKEIVDKLKRVNLQVDPTATELALSLARSFQPPAADEMVYRDLIGVLLADALASGCAEVTGEAPQICYEVASVFSKIEMYYPARAASLKRWTEHAGWLGDPEMPAPISEIAANGTIDEILALLPNYPAFQDEIYWHAVMKAQATGDVARARQIASDSANEDLRQYLDKQAERNQAVKSVTPDKLAAIQQQLARFPGNEARIEFLLYMASVIGGSDRKAGLGLLSQAGEIVNSTTPGKAQLRGQIRLAMAYCFLKSDRGFAIMESLMPKLNELVNAAAALNGVDNNYLRDAEWNMTGEGGLGRLLTELAQNAGYFARFDFDRSVILTGQFERPELRLMAQLKLAQSVLANQQNTPSVFSPDYDFR
ncbi:MAG TPA: hypothetical protein VIG25_06575 [Pyrinomonadaceae bacterium]|jgi:hypothetical protein